MVGGVWGGRDRSGACLHVCDRPVRAKLHRTLRRFTGTLHIHYLCIISSINSSPMLNIGLSFLIYHAGQTGQCRICKFLFSLHWYCPPHFFDFIKKKHKVKKLKQNWLLIKWNLLHDIKLWCKYQFLQDDLMMLIDAEDAASPVHKMLISLNKPKVSFWDIVSYIQYQTFISAIRYVLCLLDPYQINDSYYF